MIYYGIEGIFTQGVDYMAAGHCLAGNYIFLSVLTETNSMDFLEINLLCVCVFISQSGRLTCH